MYRQIFETYKVPLIFASLGFIFFLGNLVLFYSHRPQDAPSVEVKQFNSEEPSQSTDAITFVNIEGAVAAPGVYELEKGSRVVDLIENAGGILAGADKGWVSKNINKAQVLPDGAKIYIPFDGEVVTSGTSNSNTSMVSGASSININVASQSELETLPGVGEKTAEKIIESRPYSKIEDLREKNIVGESTFEKIRETIVVL